jgi:hypothetical protein
MASPDPRASSPPPPAPVVEQIRAAESALVSGEMEATIAFGDGTSATTHIAFVLGDGAASPRLHITRIYSGAESTQVVEAVTVGDTTWLRTDSGDWIASATQQEIRATVRALLPTSLGMPQELQPAAGAPVTLAWHDSSRNAEVVLELDPEGRTPVRLERTDDDGTMLTVHYRGWNTPVDVHPPVTS